MKDAAKIPETALLLINTGSPESPKIGHVAAYLARFLDDRRIIGLPWLFRKLLVYGIIVPFRSFHSAARYRKLWRIFDGQFPISFYGNQNKEKLQEALENKVSVFLGMCYGKPSVENEIKQIMEGKFSHLILLPMFPQYASSSTGAALEMSLNALKHYPILPEIQTIHSFYDHPVFITAFVDKIQSVYPESYEKILFSFHSLPLKHVQTASQTRVDYSEVCRRTADLMAQKLNLPDNQWEVTYQSQMSDTWLGPFTDQRITELGKQGTKSLLVVAPSFVSDCLETTLELGEEYKQLFLSHGGEKYRLVESLNDSPLWIQCLEEIVSFKLLGLGYKF